MISIVSATNRKGSNTLKIAFIYSRILKELGIDSEIIDFQEIPEDFLTTGLYSTNGQNTKFNLLKDRMEKAEKLLFVFPEYNGSFPGILKLAIDGLTYPTGLKNKKAAICTLSAGPMAGVLAASHFTDILNYMNCEVVSTKVRIPFINKELVESELKNDFILGLMKDQIHKLVS